MVRGSCRQPSTERQSCLSSGLEIDDGCIHESMVSNVCSTVKSFRTNPRRAAPPDLAREPQIDAPMFVKVVVAGVSGRPVMGHSGEGRLL